MPVASSRDNRAQMSTPTSETAELQELLARDPATGRILGSVPVTPPAQVDEVVEAVAKVQPLWALLRVKDRARYMRRMAQAVIDDFDVLARSLAREQGRPVAEIAALELLPAIDALIWIAQEGADVLGGRALRASRSTALTKRARLAYEPYGVVGVIGAGSAPFAQPLGQIAAALLAGNGVTFKPAARAALAAEQMARVLARAALPEGLVSIAHGGPDVGVALAQAPVDKILFTGSPAVGRVVAGAGVAREKEVTVELGGKDAMLVLADAHLQRAAACAAWAGCVGAGQARGAVERVYVARERLEHFLAALVEECRGLTVGDPADPDVATGPVVNARAVERFERSVEAAQRDGVVAAGGLRGHGDGWFVEPTVVTGLPFAHPLTRDELFLPFLTVVRVEDFDSALGEANAVPYGLTAGVFSRDEAELDRFLDEIEAGVVYVNRRAGATTGAWPGIQPFGGWKGSTATGKAGGGLYYVQQFMREQSQTVVD